MARRSEAKQVKLGKARLTRRSVISCHLVVSVRVFLPPTNWLNDAQVARAKDQGVVTPSHDDAASRANRDDIEAACTHPSLTMYMHETTRRSVQCRVPSFSLHICLTHEPSVIDTAPRSVFRGVAVGPVTQGAKPAGHEEGGRKGATRAMLSLSRSGDPLAGRGGDPTCPQPRESHCRWVRVVETAPGSQMRRPE